MVPNKPFLILNRMNLYLAANRRPEAEKMAEKLVSALPTGGVATYLEKQVDDNSFYPLDYERIIPLINDALHRALDDFEKRETLMALGPKPGKHPVQGEF
jgi:hypothetical protein